MVRKQRVWTVAAVMCCLAAAGAMGAGEEIVFIDLNRTFNEFYKTKLADAQLKELANEFNEKRKRMVGEYEEAKQAFEAVRKEAQNAALSEEVRASKRNEAEEQLVSLREKENSIRGFDETRRKQLQDQGRRMRKRIVDEIREAIRKYAANRGYTAVIDASGQSMNGIEMVVFSQPRQDITDEMIEILNKGQTGE